MGLVESTLKTTIVKPLVRADSSAPLPLFSLESAKFTNGSVGFVITTVDIAKNTAIYTHSIKTSFNPTENCILYVCDDDTIFTFIRDRYTKRVFCEVRRLNMHIIRNCLTNYESIEHDEIDKIAKLFN
jgi:hypothetical protein